MADNLMQETRMEFHEAANIFPLDEETIGELAKDIRDHGLLVPIELLDGKILDGRRRFMACERAGVKPIFKNVNPDDPVAYVVSLNLIRRQLSTAQKAMVAARIRKIYDKQAKDRQRQVGGSGKKAVPVSLPEPLRGDARDKAGAAIGVSGSYVDKATKVLANAEPEVVKAVDEGRLSLLSAEDLLDEEPEVQKEVADESKFSGGRYRKPNRRRTVEELESENQPGSDVKGVGVIRAHEAINCLSRIPKNDALRKRGFQIVTDWLKRNR